MSLLAFQDIIMSVTGIIIVVVMLITLELLEQTSNNDSLKAAATAELLRHEITTAEEARDELQVAIQRVDETAQQAALFSPVSLRLEIELEKSTIERLQSEVPTLTVKAQQLEKTLQSLEAESFELEATRRELASIRDRIAELEQQIKEEQQDNRTIFTLPRGINMTGWLVVVSGRLISAAPLGRAATPVHFESRPAVEPIANQFLTWSNSLSAKSTYILLLCRPDGSGPLADVLSGLRERGFEHGYDLIGSDQIILHPERGTAP